jgi:hypothetical protein
MQEVLLVMYYSSYNTVQINVFGAETVYSQATPTVATIWLWLNVWHLSGYLSAMLPGMYIVYSGSLYLLTHSWKRLMSPFWDVEFRSIA